MAACRLLGCSSGPSLTRRYKPDEIDPTRMDEEPSSDCGSDEDDEDDGDVDYRILSKALR